MILDYAKWIKRKEVWSEKKRCMRCYMDFTEIENMGRWECTCHKGFKVEINKGKHMVITGMGPVPVPDFRWSCCPNKKWSPNHENGCVPCDHSNWRPIMSDIDMIHDVRESWLSELRPRPESIQVSKNDGGFVSIKRIQ